MLKNFIDGHLQIINTKFQRIEFSNKYKQQEILKMNDFNEFNDIQLSLESIKIVFEIQPYIKILQVCRESQFIDKETFKSIYKQINLIIENPNSKYYVEFKYKNTTVTFNPSNNSVRIDGLNVSAKDDWKGSDITTNGQNSSSLADNFSSGDLSKTIERQPKVNKLNIMKDVKTSQPGDEIKKFLWW